MENKEMSAFPLFNSQGDCNKDAYGLTKREYFAGLAMQGILANPECYKAAFGNIDPDKFPELYAIAAIEHADELLKQLEK